MGGIFSTITDNLPSMNGIRSYLDPTAPPSGFTDMRPNIVVKAATLGEAGRSAEGLTKIKNGHNLLFKGSAALSSFNNIKRMGLVPGYDPRFKLPPKGTKANVARNMRNQQRKNSNKRSFGEKFKNQTESAGLEKKIRANKESQKKPELPPIEPKGEFVVLFGPIMKEFRIENVTRENFIEKFIEAIATKRYIANGNIDDMNERHAIEWLLKFRKLLITKTLMKEDLPFILAAIKKLEEQKENDEYLTRKEQESLDNLKKHKILLEKRSKDIQQIIKGKNKLTNKNKTEIQKIILNKTESITDTRLFIEKNIEIFKKKINDKVKELNEKIKAEKESLISPEQKMVEKIEPIIDSHKRIVQNLISLHQAIDSSTESVEAKTEDFKKLVKMLAILEKIVSKNKNGYEVMLGQYGKPRNNFVGSVMEFSDKLRQSYIKDVINKEKKKTKGIEFDMMKYQIEKEIKESDMQTLQTTLNELLQELCSKYKILSSNGKPYQISNTVPPATRHKSLDYSKLLNQINRLLLRIPKDSKESSADFMNILKIKIIIDEFMGRIGGSYFERIKYDLFSSKIDLDLKSKIPEFDSEFSKLKSEYNQKSVEQLKQDINELLAGFYSKYFPENTNIPKIGNIQEENAAKTQAPINYKNNKIPNLANSANKVPKNFKNVASVASTRNGNGN